MEESGFKTIPIWERKRPKTKLPPELSDFVRGFESHLSPLSLEVNEPDDEGLWVLDVSHDGIEVVVTWQCGYYTVGLLCENEMLTFNSTHGALTRTFYLCGKPRVLKTGSSFFHQGSDSVAQNYQTNPTTQVHYRE